MVFWRVVLLMKSPTLRCRPQALVLHLKPPTLGACALLPGLSSRPCGFTQTTSGGAWVGTECSQGFIYTNTFSTTPRPEKGCFAPFALCPGLSLVHRHW